MALRTLPAEQPKAAATWRGVWPEALASRIWQRRRVGLPPFYVPGAVRVGSTVTVVSSGRRRLCGVGPRTRLPELRWRPIPQRTVRPDLVVFPLPLPPQHARFQHAPKLFSLQKLVPQLAVERLRIPVLPRRPRLDVQRLDLRPRQPGPQRLGDELRAVVRT